MFDCVNYLVWDGTVVSMCRLTDVTIRNTFETKAITIGLRGGHYIPTAIVGLCDS